MSENLRISGAGDDSILEFGRDHSEKLQQLSRSVLSTLYMLVRSAKMYDPDNAVFERPLELLVAVLGSEQDANIARCDRAGDACVRVSHSRLFVE